MSREYTYTAIILKKQGFKEADEIITIFTREQGKLRVVAPAIRKTTSKLQYSLQGLTLARVTLVGSGTLQKVIRAEILNQFPKARHHAAHLFWAAELTLKATPDNQPNSGLFDIVCDLFTELNYSELSDAHIAKLEVIFALRFLEALGLGVQLLTPSAPVGNMPLFFSNAAGGFSNTSSQDGVGVSADELSGAIQLMAQSTSASIPEHTVNRLKPLINGFLAYQLERNINSQSFL